MVECYQSSTSKCQWNYVRQQVLCKRSLFLCHSPPAFWVRVIREGVESAKVQKGKRQKDHEKKFLAPAMQLVAIRGATKCGKDRVVHEAN